MKRVLFTFLFFPVFVNGQIINTVAGDGSLVYSGDAGAATAASFYYPAGVAADASGNVYISDAFNAVIRKVDAAGVITTVAGTGTVGFSGDGGTATAAQLSAPGSLAVDVYGNLYIADVNNARIRRVSLSGNISTVAGGGSSSAEGVADTSYNLTGPSGIAFDATGNMYISDNGRIHKITATGIITTIAGNGTTGFSGDGGPATDAVFNNPAGLAVDDAGNIYIADVDNFRIRGVSAAGIVYTFAGNGDGSGAGYGAYSGDNGPANEAGLNFPSGVAIRPGGLYITDRNNNRVRFVNASGIITTIAGNGAAGFAGDGGPAADAELSAPGGIAIDRAGNIYVADQLNNRIREITGIAVTAGISSGHVKGKTGVYPNPSPGSFTVTGLEPGERLGLYDVTGRQLYNRVAGNNMEQFDINNLDAGVYFLQVSDVNGNTTGRLKLVRE